MSNLPFPEKILHQHIAVLGKTGSGKSSALRVIAEHLLDKKKRIFVVDPKGDWWGLKSSADGKSAGYPVIAFGDFKEPRATDVPINAASGKHVAELIATGNRPCIIGFRGWMPSQLTQFWLDFAPAIFNQNEGELYGFISEVQNFAPKGKILDPNSAKMIHWTNRIMAEGRGLGITFFLDSQRSQKVHNDTLDGCETLVAMRATHPAARQSIQDWIDGNGDPKVGKEVLATLASLARGEAWVWSPEAGFGPVRVQFPMFGTFDSFAPPQVQKKVSQASWAEVNLDQVREKLASVIAEQKANDPKELRQQVAQLKAELAKKPVATKTETATAADPKAIERAVKAATTPLLKRISDLRRAATPAINAMAGLSATFEEPMPEVSALPLPPAPASRAHAIPGSYAQPTIPARTAPAPTNGSGDLELSGPQLELLQRLAQFRAIGRAEVSLAWLAASLSTTLRARGFEANLATVRRNGYVTVSTKKAKLTPAGEAIAGDAGALDAKFKVKEMLSGPQVEMLETLDEVYPNGMPLEVLASTHNTTVRARGFEANIAFLKRNEIIEVSQGVATRAEWVA